MSVDPFVIRAKHYGSAYAMTDYRSNVHYLYLSTFANLTSRVSARGTISLTRSTATLDEVVMPDVSAILAGDLSHQDFTFPEMHLYSDLDYQMLRLSLGVSWRLSPLVTVTVDGDYADLTDHAGYVYGNETGSLFVIRSGFRFEF